MILPCIDCKQKTEITVGNRSFVGCSDESLKNKNFHEDNFLYRHSCDAYEKDMITSE